MGIADQSKDQAWSKIQNRA